MQRVVIKVINEVGLHARPATIFIQFVKEFASSIMIRNASKESRFVDAKSILNILTLGVAQGHEIELMIEGEDESKAAKTLKRLIESDFDGYL
jgi:phosphocarrier protein HPr